jgi:heme-degrading monooxygenase HmoA
MHAVVVRVTLSDDDSAGLEELRQQVVPRVSQAPGFVTGYWVRLEGEKQGTSVVVFDSEEQARSAGEQFQPPEGVTLESVEIGEVVANA